MYAWAGGEGHHMFGDLNLSAIRQVEAQRRSGD
jgi:hypothetical protein